MMPRKQPQKKDNDHHDDQKNAKKKGKAVIPGGTMGTGGRDQPSSDSGDPKFDIDRAMQMMAKPLRFQKTAPSSKHPEAILKPLS